MGTKTDFRSPQKNHVKIRKQRRRSSVATESFLAKPLVTLPSLPGSKVCKKDLEASYLVLVLLLFSVEEDRDDPKWLNCSFESLNSCFAVDENETHT